MPLLQPLLSSIDTRRNLFTLEEIREQLQSAQTTFGK